MSAADRSGGRAASRRTALALALVILVAVLFVFSLAKGSVAIPLGDVLHILLGGTESRPTWQTIVQDIRLPKAIVALLAGAGLAVSGLVMQTLFRNPLAGPSVLGIDAGANLGVALVILMGRGAAFEGIGGTIGRVGAAGLGAAAVVACVLILAEHVRDNVTLLLLGLMFGYVATALVTVLLQLAAAERMQSFVLWTFGGFSGVPMDRIGILAAMVGVGVAMTLFSAKTLNALLLGDSYARSLGVRLRAARLGAVVSSSLLVGSITAFCGPILFVGVAVPHVARGLFRTSDHRLLIPTSLLVGAALTLLADLLTRIPGRSETLPVNAILSLAGAPIVAWVVLRQRAIRV